MPHLKNTHLIDLLKLATVLLCLSTDLIAQDSINEGTPVLRVIRNIKIFKESVKRQPDKKMVDLTIIPNLGIDLKYATVHNFTGKKLYPTIHTTFLRAPAARSLEVIQQELNRGGLGLKIFDAYRPYSVTLKMWELIRDERYVANPRQGSGHNRGIAIDLTLVDLKTRRELDMGTAFDNFSDTAHHNFPALNAEAIKNRQVLKSIMEKYGFKSLNTEWWHYSFSSEAEFEVLDLKFGELGIGVRY